MDSFFEGNRGDVSEAGKEDFEKTDLLIIKGRPPGPVLGVHVKQPFPVKHANVPQDNLEIHTTNPASHKQSQRNEELPGIVQDVVTEKARFML